MKQLILCRHAKSDWIAGVSDFDRPLNARGKKDAPLVAKQIANWGFNPDIIISSPANRAFTTASVFAMALQYEVEKIKKEKSIYEAQPETILEIIKSLPESADSVMLFGHNPAFESTVAALLGLKASFHLPTCGLVILESEAKWDKVKEWNMSLKAFLIPRIITADPANSGD